MTMPSAEAVNAELRALGDLVPDGIPDHHQEIGEPEQRGQIPATLPPVPGDDAGRSAVGRPGAPYGA
jgi:hypothetical protein